MKKLLSTVLLFGLISANAMAALDMNCYGTGENKGARAKMTFSKKGFFLYGVERSGNSYESIACKAEFDRFYQPRTKMPRYDRYRMTNWDPKHGSDCTYNTAMVSKTMLKARKGIVSLMVPCAHPGDYCEASYLCRVPR